MPCEECHLAKKRELFVRVLSQMKAEHQPCENESLSDYTRTWSEMIDRGGIYHINDEVCWIAYTEVTVLSVCMHSRIFIACITLSSYFIHSGFSVD